MNILDYFNFLATKAYAQRHLYTDYSMLDPLNAEDLPTLLADILKLVYQVGIPIVVVMIIYSGFLYVKARGNSSEISKAHEAIKYTLIGTAIVLGATVISTIIKGTITGLTE